MNFIRSSSNWRLVTPNKAKCLWADGKAGKTNSYVLSDL